VQLTSVPGLLADRHRDNATWIMHPASAAKVAALPEGTGFEPGPNGRGLMGWPVRLLSALPDPADAGTGDASIILADVQSACRIADRDCGQITVTRLVQRYAELGLIGVLVKLRVGGDLVRARSRGDLQPVRSGGVLGRQPAAAARVTRGCPPAAIAAP
jgi:HK97 family phage major capsid protein